MEPEEGEQIAGWSPSTASVEFGASYSMIAPSADVASAIISSLSSITGAVVSSTVTVKTETAVLFA